MKERFEARTLTGPVRLTLKDPTTGTKTIWEADKASVVSSIQTVVAEYRAGRYTLTLRQLYYQLVKANAIRNHDTVYKWLSGVLDDCRYAGKVDWAMFEDRGRKPTSPQTYDSVEQALQEAADFFRLDRQVGQQMVIEIWTEKDAISEILKRVMFKYGCTLIINKGYSSSSAMYGAYERFINYFRTGKRVTILYFGDHDPSGLDMVRDIRDRIMFFFKNGDKLKDDPKFMELVDAWAQKEELSKFELLDDGYLTEKQLKAMSDGDDEAWDCFSAARIAMYLDTQKYFSIVGVGLTKAQIRQFNLPPNPAKITDPRAKDYIKNHGNVSWEVDGLKPDELIAIMSRAIEERIDMEKYAAIMRIEEKDKLAIATAVAKINKKKK